MKSIILFLMLLFGLFGCASIPMTNDQCNATKFPTAHEHELCLKAASDYQIEQDEKEDKRLIRRDKLIIFLNACDASDKHVLVEIIRIGRSCLPSKQKQRIAMREYGYRYTHGNVCPRGMKSDFQCWDQQDFDYAMRQLGL